jgi:uncharacterized protein YjaZ
MRVGVSALSTLLVLSGCDGGSPTGPDRAAANDIRIDDPAGLLRTHEAAIRGILTSTLARVDEVLGLSGVVVTVRSDASRAIGGWGVGGFTGDARTVDIYIDPSFPGIGDVLADRLPPLLAHELHHAARWRGPGYGRTLLEAMVSEGLADHFSMELLNAPLAPWSDAIPRDRTAHFLDIARPELDSTSYSHDGWFFGANPTLPRWTGYTLGFRLVETYQGSHPGATAAQLVNASASAFRPH